MLEAPELLWMVASEQSAQRLPSRGLELDLPGHNEHRSHFKFVVSFCAVSEGGRVLRATGGG